MGTTWWLAFPIHCQPDSYIFCSAVGLGVSFLGWGIPPCHSELVAFYRIICFENTESKESQIQTTTQAA